MERSCDLKLFNMEEGAEILRGLPKPQQAAFLLHPSHGHPYPWRTPRPCIFRSCDRSVACRY
ncbi:hypothetical protein NEUTE2DRAFT_142878 [Neurospora tetrasperma FGSC 2509]|nr:hypothetical protein NEUTE2DRAFT_142878 [Neurospora tetrasperma FGSC 2509]